MVETSNMNTLGPLKCVLIREVSSFQRTKLLLLPRDHTIKSIAGHIKV